MDDPSLAWASANPASRFCDSSATMPGEEYLANEFIRWNRARFGSAHWYVGYTEPEDDLSFSFSVHFPAEQGPGDPECLRLFRMMFEHMACAVRLGRGAFNLESNRALILLDSAASVRHLSAGAERTLRPGAPLSIQSRRLVTAFPSEQSRLDRAMANALNTVTVGTTPQAIELHAAHGRRWIVVLRPMLSTFGPFGQIR